MIRLRRALFVAAVASSPLGVPDAEAVVPIASPLAEKSFRHPNLDVPARYVAAGDSTFYDVRAGRVASLVVSEPLIPGDGVGNTVTWADLGGRPTEEGALENAVWSAVVAFLEARQGLRVDVGELSLPRIGVFEHGNLIQVYSQRVLDGIPVRDAAVTAVISHGNLILVGLQNWGDAGALPAAARVSADAARLTVSGHVQPFFVDGYGRDPHLEYIPMARGDGYEFRLAWVVRVTVQGDRGTWEGLVDAVGGELIAFEDRNQYAARKAMGGVYPVSNDQVPPDGVEHPGWPMPFLHVTTPGGVVTTGGGGAIGCVAGTISTHLQGRYARINDACGAVNETSAAGDLDLGFGPNPLDTDCVVPPGHSAGDTKSARSAFAELSRINEQARGWLPNNAWLGTALLANTNVNSSCGAFWNGTSVTFYRSSAACRNTGENASIFDHEWGHGMDNNGVNPGISNPAEGIADVHANLRLDQSCVGRGFLRTSTCAGYGDPCTVCTGIRDSDWALRASGLPHGLPWIDANCGTGSAPCGGIVHCEAAVVSESAWDLAHRDFRGFAGSVFDYDRHTALELTTRLFFLGSGPVVSWYQCTNPTGGCLATGGYMNLLAADDDNGNLGDGTPHMTAIFAAFNRHNIACATPAPVNSGCAGGPGGIVASAVTPQDGGATITWTAAPNAARYYVYQTEGPNAPDFGMIKIGETTGTTFVTTSLQNGRLYAFAVLPVGSNTSCFGSMTPPLPVTPAPGPNLAVRPGSTVTIAGGDGDEFLDNCEGATVTFTVENSGTGPLTNVRLVEVDFVTHPSSVLQTPLPAPITATLADCATADGAFTFVLQGATPGQTSQIRVGVTADELGGQIRRQVLTLGPVEQDLVSVASRTYTFDASLDGWTIISGTWTRIAPGAQGTPFHVSSTENTANTCDAIRSPALRLKASSTLALWNRYQIEPSHPTGGPYDRANVGVRTIDTGVRTPVLPSGGQLYTTNGSGSGPFNACELEAQPGWNGSSPGLPSFNESTWNSAALNPGGVFTDRLAHIEIRYGTDPSLHPPGFDYDQVTVTDFDDVVADTQTNACIAESVAPVGLAVDTAGNGVMQPNEAVTMTPTWRNTGTVAIALSGATSSFTGPAGPVYANPDSAASYGTLGVAAQGSCATAGDCYTVQATTATRPLTHWDSTILETVTPTATAKTWTLHIGDSFTDVPPSNGFYRFVETILHHDVTGGCTATAYCPTASTTREAMAVFVLVASAPGAPPPPPCVAGSERFADVPASSGFCRWIEELERRAVVNGCTPTTYCPTAEATREQMAVFVLRTLDPALNPPACVAGSERFADVPASSGFCRWIEELERRGVVTGCSATNYCPTAPVTREQMSVFLTATFGLTLYGL